AGAAGDPRGGLSAGRVQRDLRDRLLPRAAAAVAARARRPGGPARRRARLAGGRRAGGPGAPAVHRLPAELGDLRRPHRAGPVGAAGRGVPPALESLRARLPAALRRAALDGREQLRGGAELRRARRVALPRRRRDPALARTRATGPRGRAARRRARLPLRARRFARVRLAAPARLAHASAALLVRDEPTASVPGAGLGSRSRGAALARRLRGG